VRAGSTVCEGTPLAGSTVCEGTPLAGSTVCEGTPLAGSTVCEGRPRAKGKGAHLENRHRLSQGRRRCAGSTDPLAHWPAIQNSRCRVLGFVLLVHWRLDDVSARQQLPPRCLHTHMHAYTLTYKYMYVCMYIYTHYRLRIRP